jgi:hypothetical protein
MKTLENTVQVMERSTKKKLIHVTDIPIQQILGYAVFSREAFLTPLAKDDTRNGYDSNDSDNFYKEIEEDYDKELSELDFGEGTPTSRKDSNSLRL